MDVTDVVELENGISKINSVISKYNLVLNSELFYLSIIDSKKYPNSLINSTHPVNLEVDLEVHVDKEEYPCNQNIQSTNIVEAVDLFVETRLKRIKDRRKWIHINKLIDQFTVWYGQLNKSDEQQQLLFNTVYTKLKLLGVPVSGYRIYGYTVC